MTLASERFFDGAQRTTALVIGDVMVDAYLWGRVERISPEAPVPVVQVHERSARLGGAANVALNMKALGANAVVVSVVGDDENAKNLDLRFKEQGLSVAGIIRSPERRTTVKTRVISGHQHIVRVDEEQEDDLSLNDANALIARVEALLGSEKPGVIVLEDYNKGVLAENTIARIIELANTAKVPVAVDPKKRNFLAYRGVSLFKPNLKELREGLKIDIDPTSDNSVSDAVNLLEAQLGNAISMITLSEHGTYIHQGELTHRIDAHRRKIADVSGAGDTVIAVAALALAQGLSAKHIGELANLAGGLVCEEVGVVPVDRTRFLSECIRLELPS
ncbi:MAG: D-glycero-beta-D-manno-heptose-7-phosphate kinase [Flavobacteriales bacterium]|nr:D-glycero-beta-D-manno-heptose-7-phosphate kinase [Flavobacteriales bacterium]